MTGSVKKKYLSVEQELKATPEWPPLSLEPPVEVPISLEPVSRPPAKVTMYSLPHNTTNSGTRTNLVQLTLIIY